MTELEYTLLVNSNLQRQSITLPHSESTKQLDSDRNRADQYRLLQFIDSPSQN